MLDLLPTGASPVKSLRNTPSATRRAKSVSRHGITSGQRHCQRRTDVALLKHLNVLGLPTILFFADKARSIHKHASRALWMLKPQRTFARSPTVNDTCSGKDGGNSVQREDVLGEALKLLELQGLPTPRWRWLLNVWIIHWTSAPFLARQRGNPLRCAALS